MAATGTAKDIEKPPMTCKVCAHANCNIDFRHDICLSRAMDQVHRQNLDLVYSVCQPRVMEPLVCHLAPGALKSASAVARLRAPMPAVVATVS